MHHCKPVTTHNMCDSFSSISKHGLLYNLSSCVYSFTKFNCQYYLHCWAEGSRIYVIDALVIKITSLNYPYSVFLLKLAAVLCDPIRMFRQGVEYYVQ